MITLQLPEIELFDEETESFSTLPAKTLKMEHSLLTLAAWESKWEKPFLSSEKRTTEESVSYLQIMCIDEENPEDSISRLSQEQFDEINQYIEAKMTATWFKDLPGNRPNRETITAEIIYYWMNALNISLEWESRHLNRLFTFIRVVNEKNKPAKKMPRADAAAQQRALNEKRLAEMGTRG